MKVLSLFLAVMLISGIGYLIRWASKHGPKLW